MVLGVRDLGVAWLRPGQGSWSGEGSAGVAKEVSDRRGSELGWARSSEPVLVCCSGSVFTCSRLITWREVSVFHPEQPQRVEIMTGKKNNNKSTLSDVGEALDSSALEKEKERKKSSVPSTYFF